MTSAAEARTECEETGSQRSASRGGSSRGARRRGRAAEGSAPAPPAAGEVLIDVAAAGIGNWDELVRIGSWQIGGPAPMALGTEAAGKGAGVGSGPVRLR